MNTSSVMTRRQISYVHVPKDGAPGLNGLIAYPAGEFSGDVTYSSTGETTPVVLCEGRYYCLRPGHIYLGRVELPMLSTPARDVRYAPTWREDKEARWIEFSMFEAIFTKILFAEFAKIGSGVFYGDWLISQEGVKANGSETNSYEEIKGGDFNPNIAINFATGELRARRGYFSGSVMSELKDLQVSDAIKTGNDYKIGSDLNLVANAASLILPDDKAYAGKRVLIVNDETLYTKSDRSTRVRVEGNSLLLGLSCHSKDMPASGNYNKGEITFLTGSVEFLGLAKPSGEGCHWLLLSKNCHWDDDIV